jgi:cob(I)alamin adenosyltransferase
MKIYTHTGDDGTTSLSGGERIAKHHLRVEAYGTVEEVISWIGLLRDHRENAQRKDILLYIQDQLMRCALTLAAGKEDKKLPDYLPDPGCINRLENEIDIIESGLPPMKNFLLPGGNVLVSYCHIARCVCRRAERSTLRLNKVEKVPDIVYKFLNRLSDYLFVLSRIICLELDIQEINWYI